MPKTKTKDFLTDPPFDAKSAEVADVAQQEDAEIQTIGAEEVGKIDDILFDTMPPPVPHTSGIEQRLGELEEKIAKVGSDLHYRSSRLEEALEESVAEHHDRLLQLESRGLGAPEDDAEEDKY